MNRHKTRCQWCPKLYTSAGAYSTHLTKAHPTENLQALEETRKRRFSDLSDSDSSLDPEQIRREISRSNFVSPDLESENEGSDRELLDISGDYDSDGGAQLSDPVGPQECAGTAIRKYTFQEENPDYNLFSPFRHRTDYQLARFFNSAKTSKAKIDQFFKNDILKALNPTHNVQFKSAYTMYKLVDNAAKEPSWNFGKVDYHLQKGVKFSYRNIISAIKYLLRQKAYADEMVWAPHLEYDMQGERVYSEMNTATWWEENQVCRFRQRMSGTWLIVYRLCSRKEEPLFPFFWHRIKLT